MKKSKLRIFFSLIRILFKIIWFFLRGFFKIGMIIGLTAAFVIRLIDFVAKTFDLGVKYAHVPQELIQKAKEAKESITTDKEADTWTNSTKNTFKLLMKKNNKQDTDVAVDA